MAGPMDRLAGEPPWCAGERHLGIEDGARRRIEVRPCDHPGAALRSAFDQRRTAVGPMVGRQRKQSSADLRARHSTAVHDARVEGQVLARLSGRARGNRTAGRIGPCQALAAQLLPARLRALGVQLA